MHSSMRASMSGCTHTEGTVRRWTGDTRRPGRTLPTHDMLRRDIHKVARELSQDERLDLEKTRERGEACARAWGGGGTSPRRGPPCAAAARTDRRTQRWPRDVGASVQGADHSDAEADVRS